MKDLRNALTRQSTLVARYISVVTVAKAPMRMGEAETICECIKWRRRPARGMSLFPKNSVNRCGGFVYMQTSDLQYSAFEGEEDHEFLAHRYLDFVHCHC